MVAAGDQGFNLLDEAGAPVVMSAEQVDFQLNAIAGTLTDAIASRPVVVSLMVGQVRTFYAGSFQRSMHGTEARFRVVEDPAPGNNPTLQRILTAWPAGTNHFEAGEIRARSDFVALTRNFQAAGAAHMAQAEMREQLAAAVARERAAVARAELAERNAPPGQAAVHGAQPQAMPIRRPPPPGQLYSLASNWPDFIDDFGPHLLKTSVFIALAPGGAAKPHQKMCWEAVTTTIDTLAAVRQQQVAVNEGMIVGAQRVLDDFVLAVGAPTHEAFLSMKLQWQTKAEGPSAIVAAYHLKASANSAQGRGNARGRGGGGKARGACFSCGKTGHFAADCKAK